MSLSNKTTKMQKMSTRISDSRERERLIIVFCKVGNCLLTVLATMLQLFHVVSHNQNVKHKSSLLETNFVLAVGTIRTLLYRWLKWHLLFLNNSLSYSIKYLRQITFKYSLQNKNSIYNHITTFTLIKIKPIYSCI